MYHLTVCAATLPPNPPARRSMAGGLPLPQAQWVLAASVKGATVSRGWRAVEAVLWGSAGVLAELGEPLQPDVAPAAPSPPVALTGPRPAQPPCCRAQAMRPRLGLELEEAVGDWMQAAAAARRERAAGRSNIVIYAAAATAAPLLGVSMLLAAAAVGAATGSVDFA